MSGHLLEIKPGQQFRKLTVIKEVERDYHNWRQFLCRCECGKEIVVLLRNLNRKKRSCGCVILPKKYWKLREKWRHIKEYNKANWPKEWEKFDNFLKDMGNNPDLTLNRKDKNKPFSKENCFWSKNRPTARLITYNETTKSVSAWAKELGISRERLRQRLNDRTLEEAMTGVIKVRKKNS